MPQPNSKLVAIGTIIVITAIAIMVRGSFQEPPVTPRVTVTIPEGSTIEDVNQILSDANVLDNASLHKELEGYLFPDTYEFFISSNISVVEDRFRENFESKIDSLLPSGIDKEALREIIIKASMIEKEVPDSDERRIVSGIIDKRIANDIPLQIDATICYIKDGPCLPITGEDKKIDSLYNTYRYLGLPEGPISNPGLDSISASINPKESEHWYYISDPKTKETIFAKSLDEHNSNVVKYLGK